MSRDWDLRHTLAGRVGDLGSEIEHQDLAIRRLRSELTTLRSLSGAAPPDDSRRCRENQLQMRRLYRRICASQQQQLSALAEVLERSESPSGAPAAPASAHLPGRSPIEDGHEETVLSLLGGSLCWTPRCPPKVVCYNVYVEDYDPPQDVESSLFVASHVADASWATP